VDRKHGSVTPDATCTSNIEGGLVFGGRPSIARLRRKSKGLASLQVSLPLGKNTVYVPRPTLEAFVIEERVLCPERRKASVGYEATIAGCRGQDSRVEREL